MWQSEGGLPSYLMSLHVVIVFKAIESFRIKIMKIPKELRKIYKKLSTKPTQAE